MSRPIDALATGYGYPSGTTSEQKKKLKQGGREERSAFPSQKLHFIRMMRVLIPQTFGII
jgi:hypothetical protein